MRIGLCGCAWLLLACGGADETGPAPIRASALHVQAVPTGRGFHDQTVVELSASSQAEIYYSLDGSPPSPETSAIYREPLKLLDSTLVRFIAYSPATGLWSLPGSELYRRIVEPMTARPLTRTLGVHPARLLLFAIEPGETGPFEQTVEVWANGTEPVTIASMELGPLDVAPGFYEPGVFEVSGLDRSGRLEPGQRVLLRVRYTLHASMRSAGITIISDEQRSGRQVIELWGRLIDW